jgi:HSP20 family molecular chaperone IbpA
MARSQALEVVEKKELVSKDEKTIPARYYVPTTDIFESDDALTLVMELPGVEKRAIDVNVENDVLRMRFIIGSKASPGGQRTMGLIIEAQSLISETRTHRALGS